MTVKVTFGLLFLSGKNMDDQDVVRMLQKVNATIAGCRTRISNWCFICLFCVMLSIAATVNSCAVQYQSKETQLQTAKAVLALTQKVVAIEKRLPSDTTDERR